jgi:signal recognition particle GTPase
MKMMVPRVYGLGDLSQILDERAYAQATAVLESMREELAKVVLTESYQKAARALDTHHFVLLVGEPASGKTTIASLLAMSSADQWGASVAKLTTPKSVVDRWNPHEKSQLFWIDDAFGVTQYESGLVSGWNHVLNEVKTILRQGNRIVMTS